MIRITIHNSAVKVVEFTSKKTGQPGKLRIQTAYAHVLGDDGKPLPVPDKYEFILDGDQAPYAAGEYQLHPSALYVNRDGRLSLSGNRLAPINRG